MKVIHVLAALALLVAAFVAGVIAGAVILYGEMTAVDRDEPIKRSPPASPS